MQSRILLDVHGASHRGERHDRNHDHFATASLSKSLRMHQSNLDLRDDERVHGNNHGHLFLVADGISGGPAPAQASGATIDSAVHYFLNDMPWYHLADGDPKDVRLALEDAVRNCQYELARRSDGSVNGMGSTLTLALVFWPDLYVAHVGDSRLYLERAGELRQVTSDHTLAELQRSRFDSADKRLENVLWNAIGGSLDEVTPEFHHVSLKPGDVIALLTDGAYEPIGDEALHATLSAPLGAQALCERVLALPTTDDRTAVIARFAREAEVTAEASETPRFELAVERDDSTGMENRLDANPQPRVPVMTMKKGRTLAAS